MKQKKPPTRRRNKPETLAAALARDIQAMTTATLPALRDLAAAYKASPVTMSRALKLLHDKGIVRVVHGKRTAILQTRQAPAPEPSSANNLFNELEAAITDGTYRVGDALPKVKYFVVTRRVSNSTVSQAFKKLAARGLIRKSGRQWIAGAGPARAGQIQAPRHRANDMPTVLIVMPEYADYNTTLLCTYLQPFTTEFFSLLTHTGMRIVLALKHDPNPAARMLPVGRNDILSFIESLGERYRGTLLAPKMDRFPDLREWAAWLCRFGKPVVWLDHDNVGERIDRTHVGRREFFRCYADSDAAVALALERLHGLGHRVIGLPVIPDERDDSWFATRRRALVAGAGSFSPPLDLRLIHHRAALWRGPAPASGEHRMVAHVNDLQDAGRRPDAPVSSLTFGRALREKLRHTVPSLATLVERDSVTALVAGNQELAVNYHHWATAMGIAVPARLSIIGFDDMPAYGIHPVSTVDPRLSLLGYRAAQLFIQSIPARADRRGNVAVKPELVDRGSMAIPRSSEMIPS
ncbi:MAG: GntR family transcriptional regulator [Chitinivibrionales bacterium]|nr:GntR family transcriptional regulator [Chitinivibrionales bacterium]MBD3397391.1 GntR family transcriptional regulator [Chitinivibrionales bacterium]